ncbi:ABC transporter [uncultured Microbacterium sp.]|uniref:ABC transporter n=1 Tax=uncultured Microbacterium sp. TaxID=191216 RepID=UPI0025FD07F5|nr:ABC transporter [uncultured Microbacterium sp.]
MSDHEVSKPAQAHDVDDAVAAAPDAAAAHPNEPAEAIPMGPADDAPAASDHVAPERSQGGPGDAARAADEGRDPALVAQSAHEGLAEAARAADGSHAPEHAPVAPGAVAKDSPADRADASERPAAPVEAEDADLAAFREAEAAYPGTFGGTFTPPRPREERAVLETTVEPVAETVVVGAATTRLEPAPAAETQVLTPAASAAPASAADSALPIFVQAPDAPRERGNRGAIFGIGLLAAVAFAILYLGTALGIAAIAGRVSSDTVGTYLLDQVRSAGLWVPVAVFAIGFWILGGIINRGRWGYWVVFGIVVGVFAYAGHILGAVGSVEFWRLGSAELAELTGKQLLAPLAIAAFVFGRELTIWFGAWAAKTGARRTVQNEEAQREYERVLEAGPQLPPQ